MLFLVGCDVDESELSLTERVKLFNEKIHQARFPARKSDSFLMVPARVRYHSLTIAPAKVATASNIHTIVESFNSLFGLGERFFRFHFL